MEHLEQTLSPAARGSYKAGVQTPSGLALSQPNPQSLCGKNKNKKEIAAFNIRSDGFLTL